MNTDINDSGMLHQVIFENSPLGIVYLDRNGVIKKCNEKAAAILGGISTECAGINIVSDTHNKKLAAAVVRACQGREEHYEGDYESAARGTRLYLKAWFSGLKNSSGELTGAIGIINDVTSQHRMEVELEETRRTFGILLGNLPGMVYRCANETGWPMIFVSEGCRELTGYSVDELIAGRRTLLGNLIVDEDKRYFWDNVHEALKTRAAFKLIYRIRTAEGRTKWVWEHGCGVYDRNLDLRSIEGFVTDISDLKKSEYELFLSEERFSKAFDSNPGMMVILALPDMKILSVNESFVQNSGFSKSELQGKLLPEVGFFPGEKELNFIVRNAIKRRLPIRNLEVRIRKKSGENIIGLISSELIKIAGDDCLLLSGFDITERKETEKALRESEERFRLLAENAQDIVFSFRISPEIGFDYISPSITDTIGYFPDDFYANPALGLEIIHPDDKPYLETLIKSPVFFPERLVIRCIHKDGRLFWLELHHSFIKNKDGQIEVIEGVMRDISESKKAHEALRESEQRFRRLFEDSPIALWEEDFTELKSFFGKFRNNGNEDISKYLMDSPENVLECLHQIKIVNVNNSAVRLYGARNKNELIENFANIIDIESLDSYRRIFLAVAGDQMSYETEAVNRTLQGEKKHVFLKWIVIPGYEEQYSRVLVSILDITQRKLAEQALQIKHEVLQTTLRYQELISNLAFNLNAMTTFRDDIEALLENIGITLKVDLVNLCSYDSANDRFYQIAGWTNGEIPKKDGGDEEDSCLDIPHISGRLIKGKIFIQSDTARLEKETAGYFTLRKISSFALIPVGREGMMRGVLCLFNRNEKKWRFEDYKLFETLANLIANAWERQNLLEARLEAERKKAEAVQIAERAARLASLGTLTAGISHEINQPLAALKMVSDGTLYWLNKNDNVSIQEIKEELSEISEQASRIDNIIKHMRTLAKPERDFNPELININEIIQRVFALIGAQLAAHRITVTRDLDNTIPEIRTIPTLIEQIGINLIINAMQALDAIDRGDKNITVKSGMRDKYFILEFLDNGPGIPPENINRVFDPFFTTKVGSEGMGLGLSIVQNFVSALGGLISVRNRQDGGAHFTIMLPVGNA